MGQSLISLIRRLFWILLGVFLIFFSVNNRTAIDLVFEPFDFIVPGVPAFWLLFIGIFIGLILAATVTGWIRLKGFARRRQAERRADFLEDRVSALSEDVHKSHAEKAHTAASDTAATETLPKAGKSS